VYCLLHMQALSCHVCQGPCGELFKAKSSTTLPFAVWWVAWVVNALPRACKVIRQLQGTLHTYVPVGTRDSHRLSQPHNRQQTYQGFLHPGLAHFQWFSPLSSTGDCLVMVVTAAPHKEHHRAACSSS